MKLHIVISFSQFIIHSLIAFSDCAMLVISFQSLSSVIYLRSLITFSDCAMLVISFLVIIKYYFFSLIDFTIFVYDFLY